MCVKPRAKPRALCLLFVSVTQHIHSSSSSPNSCHVIGGRVPRCVRCPSVHVEPPHPPLPKQRHHHRPLKGPRERPAQAAGKREEMRMTSRGPPRQPTEANGRHIRPHHRSVCEECESCEFICTSSVSQSHSSIPTSARPGSRYPRSHHGPFSDFPPFSLCMACAEATPPAAHIPL